MKIVLSVDQVPELTDLTPEQKRRVLIYYHFWQPRVPGFRFLELGFVGLIILAEIAGFIGGFVYWRTPFWGPLVGAAIGLVGVMAAGYTLGTVVTVPKLRRFLQSEEAQTLIKSFGNP